MEWILSDVKLSNIPEAEAARPCRKPFLRSARGPLVQKHLPRLISACGLTRVVPVLKFPFCVVLQRKKDHKLDSFAISWKNVSKL